MNKKNIYLIGGIFSISAGLAVLLPWFFEHRNINIGPLSYEIKEESYKKTGSDNRDTYTINLEYPVFTDGFDNEVIQKVNDTIFATVRTISLSIKREFEDQYGSSNGSNIYIPVEPLLYESGVTVSAELDKLPFVNIVHTGYEYSGGAHGITVIKSEVFDIKTGNEITLHYLFEGDYLKTLSKLTLDEIKKKDPELKTFIFAEDGTLPNEDNFKVFTLMPDGMHIIFQDYQVGPYVLGSSEVVLSYSSLRNIISARYGDILK